MKKLRRTFVLGLLAFTSLFALAELKQGVDYTIIPKPIASENPGKIEVQEFFWYRCSHCFEAQPLLDQWAASAPKDVVLRPIHVMWPGRTDMEGHARLYLALKETGTLSKVHAKVFDATFRQELELRREDVLGKWLTTQQVDANKVLGAMKSFGVNAKLAQLQKLTSDSGIDGTPTFIVAGKYKLIPTAGKSLADEFTKLTELVAFARKQGAGK
ncbi:thiol:disulfide interchange protein DsbA/DsbL [Burkholderiaceae bacterium DAT-1]|nr:thiol:disulfide interchange protein DsbA/DsbL [Burkholderiaceae bacterium DAT-1]